MTMNAIQPNQVLDCARPIFYLVSDVKANSENLSDNFFDEVIEKFSEFERDASQKSINSRMVHEAKYALAAFVDELVLSSNYPKKPQWMSKPLQLELFGEHLAGEGFYQHLSELRQLGAQFVDVIEVYYICIQLGFMGKYRLQQQEAFLGLQADLRSQIEAIRGSNDPWLSSNAIPKEGVLAKVSREIPSWVMQVLQVH